MKTIKEKVHKELLKIDDQIAKEMDNGFLKDNVTSDDIAKLCNTYVFNMIDKTIDLTLKEVQTKLEEVEKKGWRNNRYFVTCKKHDWQKLKEEIGE